MLCKKKGRIHFCGFDLFLWDFVSDCGSSEADCLEVTVDITDNLQEVNKKSYTVFPNPADDYLQVAFADQQLYEITLFDFSARKLIQTAVAENSIQLSTKNLASGIYWMRIMNSDGVSWEQVEIVR